LRLAGLRDHADGNADFGIPTDNELHRDIAGYTPRAAPGAKTIQTAELPTFLAASRPSLSTPYDTPGVYRSPEPWG
jgi:hypothetical protein